MRRVDSSKLPKKPTPRAKIYPNNNMTHSLDRLLRSEHSLKRHTSEKVTSGDTVLHISLNDFREKGH